MNTQIVWPIVTIVLAILSSGALIFFLAAILGSLDAQLRSELKLPPETPPTIIYSI